MDRPRLACSLRPERRQILAFSMHQSLEILQMTQLELDERIQSEAEKNPVLEISSRPNTRAPRPQETAVADRPTFFEYLIAQARDCFESPHELSLAMQLIELLDERGYLPSTVQLADAEQTLVDRIAACLKTFDPPGVFAKDLRECLLLQLSSSSQIAAKTIVESHYEDLIHSRFAAIQKTLRLDARDFQEALKQISRLHTRPASSYQDSPCSPLTPDLTIREIEGSWQIFVGEEDFPRLTFQSDYEALCPSLPKGAEKDTLRTWISDAKSLARCIERRRSTLLMIGKWLLKHQRSYFLHAGPIVPLGIDALAQILNSHETTARRAIANKILASPCGLIPLEAFFFKSSTSAPCEEQIQLLIAAEDKLRPLTDDRIAQKLADKGLSCARRTIVKYRNRLGIPSAAKRKATGL